MVPPRAPTVRLLKPALGTLQTGGVLVAGGSPMRVWPGKPYPLGATWDGAGVNFALYSEHGAKVELCLFDSVDGPAEAQRITLPEHTDQVCHAYLPDCLPAQLYGYLVH